MHATSSLHFIFCNNIEGTVLNIQPYDIKWNNIDGGKDVWGIAGPGTDGMGGGIKLRELVR
jgi:hypothetical protein